MNASASAAIVPDGPAPGATRVTSIDALRGLVMFTMIYVNDLAGAPKKIVPAWMEHFHGKNGMTFVDLVFPAFVFLMGMSIPFALGSRVNKGEPLWRTVFHVVTRTLSLLFIGIMMVHETPDSAQLGWSGTLWVWLMFLSAIAAFCSITWPGQNAPSARAERICRGLTVTLRAAGLISLVILAFTFRDKNGRGIITLSPFAIRTSWYGILGIIGWAYLAGAIVFLVFRGHRTALLACMVLLLCLYPADKKGLFDNVWLGHVVGLGETLGAHGAIAVGGLLLGSMLASGEMAAIRARTRFTLLFVAGCAAGAVLLNRLYGISKNDATTSWCLWSCAITAALWLGFYCLCDVRPVRWIARPLAVAGQNVLLAYLLSEMIESPLPFFDVEGWQGGLAGWQLLFVVARSALWALLLLLATAGLNRAGFRLKL